MKVTVFVPIQMNIEGIDRTSEVQRVLTAMESIISQSELEANPCINVELVGDAEIVNDEEEVETVRFLTTKENEILTKAAHLLSADDGDEVFQMVKAIITHENQDDLIDYIDGVCVWQKVELEFTAKQFCEEIGYTGNEFKN